MTKEKVLRQVFELSYKEGLRKFSRESDISIFQINKIRAIYRAKGIRPLVNKNKNQTKFDNTK